MRVRGPIAAAALVGALALPAAPVEAAPRAEGVEAHAPDLPARSDPALARRAGSSALTRRALRRRLRSLARRAPGASGFFVSELGQGSRRVLFERKHRRRRKLASNTKLFTTATALHRLGAGSRIATVVRQRGSVGPGGRLNGRLFVVGAGDPALGKAQMRALARQVSDAGIKRVTDGVAGDDTVFDRRRGVPDSGWAPSPYIAPLSGLVYGGSTYARDPALDAAAAFREALRRRGVKVFGGVRVGSVPERLAAEAPLASVDSPTIAALVAATNKSSSNFYAEMLLKRLWAKPGRIGTTRGGAKAVKRFAAKLGSGIRPRDGSGLTDGNKASPREVVRLLAAMRSHRAGPELYDSLAIAGRDGTLADRMGGTRAAGRCRGKTGTISGVSTLSGYCNAGAGKIAFSLLMNGVGDYAKARRIQDRMVVAIARYRG